jgi:hypothetical protein
MLLKPFGDDADRHHSLPVLDGVDYLESRLEGPSGPILPNCHEWAPGDVVLYRAAGGFERLQVDPIRRYQVASGFDREIAQFIHVGIFVGRNLIWEANPSFDVHAVTVRDALKDGRVISVRRFRHQSVGETALLEAIQEYAPKRYLMAAMAPSLLARFAGYDVKVADQQYVICSMFVQGVLSLCLCRSVLSEWPVAVPADFAVSDDFEDVPVYWCRPSIADVQVRCSWVG